MEGVNIGNIKIPAIKGDIGEQGEAGEIKDVIVTLLEPTAEPFAKNLGTKTQAILYIGIPANDNIVDMTINEEGELVTTLESNTELNAGVVKGTGIQSIVLESGSIIIGLTDGSTINAGNIYDDELCKQKIEEYNSNAETKIAEIQALYDKAITVEENINKSQKQLDELSEAIGDISNILDEINGEEV